jgi:hypothetical protein
MLPGEAIQASARVKAGRMLARLPTYLADARAHPGWTFMFLFGRFLLARRLSAAFVPRVNGFAAAPADGADAEALSDASASSVADTVRRDGICTGLRLPAATVAEIRAFADNTTCYASMDRRMPFLPGEHAEAERRYGRTILVGHFLEAVLDCPAAAAVARNRWLHAVAAEYLGAAPKIIATRLWWSFPAAAANQTDLSLASQDSFHFDLDDWKQIKFFFYLTDVDERTGPHIYARGSHARRPLSHQFTLFVGKPDAAIIAAYGAEALETVTGPAGSGFVEDPFGFHTGSVVQRDRRLILEISFGISGVLRRRRFGEMVR